MIMFKTKINECWRNPNAYIVIGYDGKELRRLPVKEHKFDNDDRIYVEGTVIVDEVKFTNIVGKVNYMELYYNNTKIAYHLFPIKDLHESDNIVATFKLITTDDPYGIFTKEQ